MAFLLLLLACEDETLIPEDALFYEVTVTAVNDECHPEATAGYQETFIYTVALDASSASIFIGEQKFAAGVISGCDIEYSSPIIGEETDADGEVKWQLFGQASFACSDDPEGWLGTEYFEIVASDDETLDVGCNYEMTTEGKKTTGG